MRLADQDKPTVAFVPPWLISRFMCSIGVFVLVQNIMILHYGSEVLSHPNRCKGADIVKPRKVVKRVRKAKKAVPMASPKGATVAKGASLPKAEGAISMLTLGPEPVYTPPPVVTYQPPTNSPAISVPGLLNADVPDHIIARLSKNGVFVGAGGYDSTHGVASQKLQRESTLDEIPRSELRLFGVEAPVAATICVGVSSVSRRHEYVYDSMAELLGSRGGFLTKKEQAEIMVVLHLADFNAGWVQRTSEKLQKDYVGLIREGRLHGIHAPSERYPELDLCPPLCTFGEPRDRVRWRAKQNIDYAFLMYYAAPLAQYYLQVEDDVSFTPNWVQKITEHVSATFPADYKSKESNAPWRVIGFSELGFVGKLFQSNELRRVAQFLLLFYDEMPSDKLLTEWHKSMTQGKMIDYYKQHPSLFRHVGMERSDVGATISNAMVQAANAHYDNPAGDLHCEMTLVPTFDSKFVYFPGGEPTNRNDVCDYAASVAFRSMPAGAKRCWLWGKGVQNGNHITLVFTMEISLTAILVELGHSLHPKDVLKYGALEVAQSTTNPGVPAEAPHGRLEHCGRFSPLVHIDSQSMLYWEKGVSEPRNLPTANGKVRCLRIMVLRTQQEWFILQRIQVRST